MIPFLETLLAGSVLVFPVASMLSIGLGYTLREIAGPLRHPQRIFRALVANFVLAPLVALGISRALSLEPAFATGLMLIGTAAGAPFLLKLTRLAGAEPGLAATFVVLLMPLTAVYMPLVVPIVIPDASVSAMGIAAPLVATLILPLVLGLVVDSFLPRWAARLRPLATKASSVALAVLVASTVVVNAPLLAELLGTGAIAAAFLLVGGAFCAGYLIASPGAGRRTVMGLGTAQRNIAAAMVVASRDFDDPNVLVMVVVVSVIDLVVLFPTAWVLRRRSRGRTARPERGRAGARAARTSPRWTGQERS